MKLTPEERKENFKQMYKDLLKELFSLKGVLTITKSFVFLAFILAAIVMYRTGNIYAGNDLMLVAMMFVLLNKTK